MWHIQLDITYNAICRRCTVVDWRLWSLSTSLCWRHSDLRVPLTNAILVHGTIEPYFWVHQCCFQLDAITQAPAQHCQNRNCPANHWSTFESATTTSLSRLWLNYASPCRPWPWNLHWRWRFYKIPQIPASWKPRLPVLHFYVGFGASAARYLGLSSSRWCRVWCYLGWTTAMQCWLAFHYTLHGACNRWWTWPHGAWLVFTSSKCDHITLLLRQLHWLKVPWRIDYKLAVLVYKVFMAWHRHTSLTNSTIQQSRSFESVCIPLCLTNCLFPVPDSQLTATEHFQSPLYRSGTA